MSSKINISVPYLIADENETPYFALLFGIIQNNLDVVRKAISDGANVDLIKVNETFGRSAYSERLPMVTLLDHVTYACQNEEIVSLVNSASRIRQRDVPLKVMELLCSEKAEAEILPEVQNLVTEQNLNQLHHVFSLNDPLNLSKTCSRRRTWVTFLQVAIQTERSEVVKWLLSAGANPNLEYILADSHSYTGPRGNAGSVVVGRFYKSTYGKNPEPVKNMVISLLEAGCDFGYRYSPEIESPWEMLLTKIKSEDLRMILKNHSPKSLKEIAALPALHFDLYEEIYLDDLDKLAEMYRKYPLIGDMVKYEKLPVCLDQESMRLKGLSKFLRSTSITSALQERYGVSSPRFVKSFLKNVRVPYNGDETSGIVTLGTPEILVADFLKMLFIEGKNNQSDFLNFFESLTSVPEERDSDEEELSGFFKTALAGIHADSLVNLAGLLKDNFTVPQIRTILNNSNEDEDLDSDVIFDLLNLHFTHEAILNETIKHADFSEIDSLLNILDFFENEAEGFEYEDFPLEQETHTPVLKKLKKVKVSGKWG